MSGDSQAKFTLATKSKIRKKYRYRCAICLRINTPEGSQCAHLLDAAGAGAKQVAFAVKMGVLMSGHKRNSQENGMVQCAGCHQGLFTPGYTVLSPPPQVLQYILEYLKDTDRADRKPLHEVFSLLNDAAQGHRVDLPDPKSILPFLGLNTLVVLLPDELQGAQLIIHHLPGLSILDKNQFIPAPADTLPDTPGVARIFDVLAIPDKLPETHKEIPLLPHHAEYTHQRYWRLPVQPEVVLTIFMERIIHTLSPHCEEINQARHIYGLLLINLSEASRLPSGRKRTSDNPHDDEPPHKQSRGRGASDKTSERREKFGPVVATAAKMPPRRTKRLRLKI